MSQVYTIYTLGGGEALTATFHMVNSILGTDNYITAIKISVGFGLLWVLLQTALQGKYLPTAQWTLLFVVMFNVLFVPKADVVIVDRLERGTVHSAVNNIPWGLAWFASLTSEVGDVVTRTMEMASSLPDDLRYHKNGLMLGSKLVEQSRRVRIVDASYARNIEQFIKQCVFYDLYLGKYDLKAVFGAENIWSFILKQKPSPIRAFNYDQSFMTCQSGAEKLEAAWSKQVELSAGHWGKRFFRSLTLDEARAQWLSLLPGSYQYVLGISNQAGSIMQQNMMMNAFYSAIKNHNSELGADAAIANFVHTRAEAQAESAYAATAKQAEKFVPLLRIAFEALYYGAFPLMLLAMMLPIGPMIAKNYFFAFVWLQSWGPLYAVLNLLMNLEARSDGLAASTIGEGEHALTLMTQTGIGSIHGDISTIAGYLSISIPFIAAGMTRGVGSFRHLVTSMLAIAQGAGTTAASEATTGNIRLANSSQGVHAHNNMQANQWHTSARHDGGATEMTGRDGEQVFTSAGGRKMLDDHGAHSEMPSAVMHGFNRLSQSMGQQSSQLQQYAEQDSRQSSQSEFSAYTQSGIFERGQSRLQQSMQGHNQFDQTRQEQAATELQQHSRDFSERNQVNQHDSAQILASATAGLPFENFFKAVGLDLSAGFTGLTRSEQEAMYQKAIDYSEQHQLRDSAQSIMSQMVSHERKDMSGEQQQLFERVSNDWQQHQSFAESAEQKYLASQQMERVASQYEQLGVEGQSSLQQAFFEYLQQQPSPGAGMQNNSPMGEQSAIALLHDHHRQDMLQQHMGSFLQEQFGSPANMSNNLHQQYQEGTMPQSQSTAIQARYQSQDAHMQATANATMSAPLPDVSSIVAQAMQAEKEALQQRTEQYQTEGQHAQQQVEAGYKEMDDRGIVSVSSSLGNNSLETFSNLKENVAYGVDKVFDFIGLPRYSGPIDPEQADKMYKKGGFKAL